MKRSPLRRKTPLKKISAKRRSQSRLYEVVKRKFLLQNPRCQICTDRNSLDVHHRNHREGNLLILTSEWLAVCRPCHRRIHDHPAWARENGYLI